MPPKKKEELQTVGVDAATDAGFDAFFEPEETPTEVQPELQQTVDPDVATDAVESPTVETVEFLESDEPEFQALPVAEEGRVLGDGWLEIADLAALPETEIFVSIDGIGAGDLVKKYPTRRMSRTGWESTYKFMKVPTEVWMSTGMKLDYTPGFWKQK